MSHRFARSSEGSPSHTSPPVIKRNAIPQASVRRLWRKRHSTAPSVNRHPSPIQFRPIHRVHRRKSTRNIAAKSQKTGTANSIVRLSTAGKSISKICRVPWIKEAL